MPKLMFLLLGGGALTSCGGAFVVSALFSSLQWMYIVQILYIIDITVYPSCSKYCTCTYCEAGVGLCKN